MTPFSLLLQIYDIEIKGSSSVIVALIARKCQKDLDLTRFAVRRVRAWGGLQCYEGAAARL